MGEWLWYALVLLVAGGGSWTCDAYDPRDSMVSLVVEKGYPLEVHEVLTEDNYILTVFRIPYGKKNVTAKNKPVIIQHGVYCSSAAWVMSKPHEALGFILADNGYDVWMPNSRGTTYSEKHATLETDSEDYWNFSFHEMGEFDLPATIDYILAKTGKEKVHYVAHSQGTTIFFVMNSIRSEYSAKVTHMSALAPIAAMEHTQGLVRILGYLGKYLCEIAKFMNWNAILRDTFTVHSIKMFLCKYLSPSICVNIVSLLTGFDTPELNPDVVPLMIKYTPAGASAKQLEHYTSLLNNGGKFTHFDYGEENQIKYNQSTPPEYDLSKVNVPVMLYYSTNDWISRPEDVLKLSNQLPKANRKLVPFSSFNHIDFMWAVHAYELLFSSILDSLEQFDRT